VVQNNVMHCFHYPEDGGLNALQTLIMHSATRYRKVHGLTCYFQVSLQYTYGGPLAVSIQTFLGYQLSLCLDLQIIPSVNF
jgi:hypothetical protein